MVDVVIETAYVRVENPVYLSAFDLYKTSSNASCARLDGR